MTNRSFLPEHNPFFDPIVDEAHDFVTNELGLHPSGPEKVAVVNPAHVPLVRERLGAIKMGGFNPDTGEIILIPQPDEASPKGATARLGSYMVHELVHSDTFTPGQHTFYTEAVAGIGEAKYLQWLQARGRWVPAADYVLHRAGATLLVPGAFRHYEPSPGADKPANSSNGLIASIGVGLGMHNSGMKAADVMRVSSYHGTEHYDMMRQAVNSLRPGLAEEVEAYPQTTDGIIQATAAIQGVARARGLIK
jgi:hypothetical protein